MTTTRSFVAVALVVFLAAGRVQAQADGEVICPLSENQQEESQNAWAALAEVFKHDRCSNCHGKKNPFLERTTHPDRMPIELDERGEIRVDADGNIPEVFFAPCETCHDQTLPEKWKIPPPRMLWWDQSVEELCRTQHKFRKPFAFINHSRRDQLILEAFTGRIGLNEIGRDMVETEPYPDPPPVSHEEFIGRVESWLEAQDLKEAAFGDPWQGDEVDCGCVPQLYEVVIDAKFNSAGAFAGCSGESQISETIPIDFTAADGESKYTGSATGTLTVSNFSCPVSGCTVDFRPATTDVQLEGDVEKVNGAPSKLTMKVTRTVGATSFTVTCPCEGPGCPTVVTLQVPQTPPQSGDVPQLDARLGTYDRSVPPGTLTITIRKRN